MDTVVTNSTAVEKSAEAMIASEQDKPTQAMEGEPPKLCSNEEQASNSKATTDSTDKAAQVSGSDTTRGQEDNHDKQTVKAENVATKTVGFKEFPDNKQPSVKTETQQLANDTTSLEMAFNERESLKKDTDLSTEMAELLASKHSMETAEKDKKFPGLGNTSPYKALVSTATAL